MFQSLNDTLGPWAWVIFGLVVLAAEIFLPGVYLMWFGLAAITTGLISLGLWAESFWQWQIQLLVFGFLSLAYVLIARRYLKSGAQISDQPLLNNREGSLIGRTATLSEAIVEGYGRIKLDDSIWRVEGQDAPIGTRVVVTGANAQILRVEPISSAETIGS